MTKLVWLLNLLEFAITYHMSILKLTEKNQQEIVDKVSCIIKNGGIAIVPFDTVYGIACDPRNDEALEKVFLFKKRSTSQTIGLATFDMSRLNSIADLNELQERFLVKVTPGRYTFIVPVKDQSISKFCQKNQTIGIRIPDSSLIRQIAELSEGVIAQTSANKSGQSNCFSIDEIFQQYSTQELEQADIIVDGGLTDSQEASLILDLTEKLPKLIERK